MHPNRQAGFSRLVAGHYKFQRFDRIRIRRADLGAISGENRVNKCPVAENAGIPFFCIAEESILLRRPHRAVVLNDKAVLCAVFGLFDRFINVEFAQNAQFASGVCRAEDDFAVIGRTIFDIAAG